MVIMASAEPNDGDKVRQHLHQMSFDALGQSLFKNRNHWYSMLSSWFDNEVFVREYAYPARKTCLSVYDAHRYLLYFAHERCKDSYSTVYAFRRYQKVINGMTLKGKPQKRKDAPDYNTAIIDRIFFDLDASDEEGKSINQAYNDALLIKQVFGKSCDVIFTGNRGFHVYINLQEVITDSTLLSIQTEILNKMKLKTVDECCFGDVARVLRIPFTIHSKTGCQVLPVMQTITLKGLQSVSAMPKGGECTVPFALTRKTTTVEGIYDALKHVGY